MITAMGEKGIYTLVDAHQDVFARRLCGEGVPDFYAENKDLKHSCEGIIGDTAWLIGACKSMNDFDLRYDSNGNPLVEDCVKNPFVGYYPTVESESAFKRLYVNIDGVQDAFIGYWNAVSAHFVNNPYVIGYDPLNEPFPANFYDDAGLIL